LSWPFHFLTHEQDTPIHHRLRLTWRVVEREAETSGLDVLLLTTRSANYGLRRLPHYDPETRTLAVDLMSGWQVLLAHLVEGLSLHATRGLYRPGNSASLSRWRSAAAEWAEEHRRSMDDFAASMARPARRLARRSQATTGVGRGNWDRPDVHPLHCQALKSNYTPCRAMRVKGSAFCYQHQDWRSNLPTLGDILGDLQQDGWARAIGEHRPDEDAGEGRSCDR
jgi:hypothetical protein